ncbi:cell division protein [Methanoculleus taiwanensis]|uniref:Tubulin-like protein CetZ n=1 Tax=Methanoculleus taiwanensis TaxID=1550565 RepID=A0A498H2N1_9EURY|nr:tubulin/FtsZ family protein [Methanoculleus taiwanensis]RXE56515.1 cell division protein [Methanoculleus taiwanensis]
MRVLAIGLGGAGARIVDKLYDHDRRSKVCCMSAVAIDIEANTLLQLRHLPETARIFFPPIDPDHPYDIARNIDIEEVMTRVQRLDTLEIDAILLCCGLGGSMVDFVPIIVKELRTSYVEPIFAVAILPRLAEGKKISAKAAADLELLREITDGTILFDNETWHDKLKSSLTATAKEKAGIKNQAARRIPSFPQNPRDMYDLLNDRIARQVGLLLRAGEFNEAGLEVAEIVLDAGEVLNTLQGSGYVSVGYAAEPLPGSWFDLFNRWRSSKYFIEGSHEKAARIVALAKRAVYEETSIPCDLTSADKALVLIAGPSAELSMKGFQTVRKWIDRSIAGLEMRSGDYPVKNTSYVGIIIMLSGLHNIPRVEEINQIRIEYLLEREEEERKSRQKAYPEPADEPKEDYPWADETEEEPYRPEEYGEEDGDEEMAGEATEEKDEMISLPGSKGEKKFRDDTIETIPRAAVRGDEDTIVLPGKEGKREIDITRKTVVSSAPAPKNGVFGPKEIRANSAPKELDASSGFTASVKPVQRPKEGTMTGEAVSLKQGGQRARDEIFSGDTVRIGDRPQRPSDDLLGRSGRGFDRGAGKPREVVPSRSGLNVIDHTTRTETGKKQKDDDTDPDDDFVWIT